FKRSIALAKRNPKLFLLAIVLLVFSTGSINNYNFDLPSSSQDNQETEIQENRQNNDSLALFNNLFIESENETNGNELNVARNENSKQLSQTDQEETSQINNLLQLLDSDRDKTSIQANNTDLSSQVKITEKIFAVVKNIESIITEANKKVPDWVYIFFILEIIIFALIALGFSLTVSAWSQAAMIEGVRQAEQVDNNNWSLSLVSRFAISKIKPMIWISIHSMVKISLLIIAIVLLISASIGLGVSLFNTSILITIVCFLLAFALVVILSIKIIEILFTWIVGQRLVVFKEITATEAYQKSKEITQGNLGRMILLSLSHLIILKMILTSIAALPLVAAIGMFVASNFQSYLNVSGSEIISAVLESFTTGWISIILLSALITIIASVLVRLIVTVIKNANWHWATLSLLSETDNSLPQTRNPLQKESSNQVLSS
ncbi:MAG: hypothetical protein XD95_0457, partial [Microgenomates bacterium 39_7]